MENSVEDCLEDKAWTCIQQTAEVLESFAEFVSADVGLVCSKELTDHVITAQVHGVLEDEPEEEEDEEDISLQKVSAVDAHEPLRAL